MDRESFFCPITHEVMQDPVVDPEGNTFERSAIEGWLSQHTTSPLTRTPLTKHMLVPNRALKEVIQEELKRSADAGDTQWTQAKSKPAEQTQQQSQQQQQQQQQQPQQQPQQQQPQLTEEQIQVLAKAEEVHLKVTSGKLNADEALIHASVIPGVGTTRSPADIVCVVDISGSMGTEASVKTGSGEERHGLSLLDIVKHAVKTVILSLQASDRFALVVFSTTARVVWNLSYIKDIPRDKLFAKIAELEPEDTTNLWDGLVKGLDILKTSVPGRVSALLLLTDGLPNISPPRGEYAMLKKYKDEHKQLNTTINTFGFGYAIDTPLLTNLATEGHGMHSFIPDASFVGTAFVNSVSNLLVSMGTNVVLSFEPVQGVKIVKVLGAYQSQLTSWGAQVNLCSLQYGQTKDVVVQVSGISGKEGDIVNCTLKFEPSKTAEVTERTASCGVQETADIDLQVHHLRLDFVSSIAFVVELVQNNKCKEADAAIADIEERVRKCDDPRTKALLQDITGQVKEAIRKSPENYFQKWGRHYLPSLARAHLLQQCNNFKDPGIQVYGGQLFQNKRDEIDDIFLKLPPPTPLVRRSAPISYSSSSSSSSRSGYSSSSYSAPRSMSVYHNAAGPCFAGDCRVLMASGDMKLVRDISRGDVVQSAEGTAEVLGVIKTLCIKDGKEGIEDLVAFPGGLKLTPYHPVRINNTWNFPADLHPWMKDTPCDAVFNFVLSQGHVMIIEGVECVTLGHNFIEDVVRHSYFGSERVVKDLQKMRGWESGLVVLNPALCKDNKCMIRDKDGKVCGFDPAVLPQNTSRMA